MVNLLATARDFFIPNSYHHNQVMAWGAGGILEPLDPQPLLLRAFYLSPHEVETRMEAARTSLAAFAPAPQTLLCILPGLDVPPARLIRVFKHGGSTVNTPCRDFTGHTRAIPMDQYFAVTGDGHAWDTDDRDGRSGYFLTGDSDHRSLWKLLRIDRDAFRGPIFTVTPVELALGFPRLDLSSIPDPLRKAELTQQYEELQRCVANNAFRGIVSRAKDLAEGLLPLAMKLPSSKNFAETLERALPLIQAKQSPVTALTYHLCQKLRYLHQRTHPDRAVQSGRPITPEFALTAVQDVIEILGDLGYTKSSPC